MIEAIEGFRLPRYAQIPDVGLYLEQVVRLCQHTHLALLGELEPDKLHGEQLREAGADLLPYKKVIHSGAPLAPVYRRSQACCPVEGLE